jgi:hypothetical protein
VRLSIQLRGRSIASLWSFPPKERDAALRVVLKQQLARLKQRFSDIEFVSRDPRKGSWTIDAVVPARKVRALAQAPQVRYVTLSAINGRPPRPAARLRSWYCVWGVVAVQIEDHKEGFITLEDRLVVVKALDESDAQRRLQRHWSAYARPYLNPAGELVRWQLIDVQGVYALYDDTFDARGTEVFSRLRRARLRPEHRWHPRRKPAVQRRRR